MAPRLPSMARNAKAENIMVELSPQVRKALEKVRDRHQKAQPDTRVSFRSVIAKLILDEHEKTS